MEMLYTTTYGVWDFPTEADDIVKIEGVFSGSSVHEAGKSYFLWLFHIHLCRLYGTMWVVGDTK